MKKLVNVKELSREEWLEWRKKGIGGSDAAAVMGLNRYRGPISVWMDKTGRKHEQEEPSEAMRLGTDREDYVAKRFTEETGKKVRRNNYMMQHDDYHFMIADIDREIVGENALLECKTASPYAKERWAGDNTPEEYVIQCLHYMAVTGAEKVYLACLILQTGVVIREIERDDEAIAALEQREKEFWVTYVVPEIMPPSTGSDADDEEITAYCGDSMDGLEIDLPSSMSESLKRLDVLKDMKVSISSEITALEDEIKAEMKDAEVAYLDGRKITWRTSKPRQTFDSKRFKKDHADLYEEYIKVGKPVRTFKIAKAE